MISFYGICSASWIADVFNKQEVTMVIKINDKDKVFQNTGLSIRGLLSEVKIDNPAMVAVQLNGVFVKPQEHDTVMLKDGDRVDFLFFMGGGRGGYYG